MWVGPGRYGLFGFSLDLTTRGTTSCQLATLHRCSYATSMFIKDHITACRRWESLSIAVLLFVATLVPEGACPPSAPSPPSTCTQTYAVVSGDTCEAIARRFSITLQLLQQLNPTINSACTNLQIGQQLCVAAGIGGPVPPTPAPSPSPPSTCTQTYAVVSGDICEAIARRFSITLQLLQQLNPTINSNCTNLQIGQQLCVAAGSCILDRTALVDPRPINGLWTLNVSSGLRAGQVSGWDLVLTTATQGLTFSNSQPITIPGIGVSASYIYVTGLVPPLRNIRVVLRGVNHPVISDLVVLLISPLRLQEAVLFRGACLNQPRRDVISDIIIDDRAGRALLVCDPLAGEYKSQSGSALTDAVNYLSGCQVPPGYVFVQGQDFPGNDIGGCGVTDPATGCSQRSNCVGYSAPLNCLKSKLEPPGPVPLNSPGPCDGVYIKQVCAPGHGGEGCPRCAVGTYGPGSTISTTACQSCGPGRTTLQPGSTSLQDCVCAPGYGGAGCTLCGVGTWSAGNSFDSCVPCASGKTTLIPGSTSATACVCAAGFGGSGATTCTLCTKGSYKVVGDGACTSCGSARTTLGSGPWTRPEDCVCAAGYQRSGTGPTCTPCPIGSYALEGSTSCSSCGSTSTTVAEASTSAAACVCLAGYGGSGATTCTLCTKGSFKAVGDGACTPCDSTRTTLGSGPWTGPEDCVAILCQKDFTPQSPLLCSRPGQAIDLPTAAECTVDAQGFEWVPSSTTGTCPPHGQQSVFHLIADVSGTGQYIFKALHVKNDVCGPPVGLTCSLGTSSASPIRCTTNQSLDLLLRGDCQTTSTSTITVTTAAGQIISSTLVTCPPLGTTITYVLTATSRDPIGLSDPMTCAPRTQTIFVTNQRQRSRK